jgi:hypothetical protein
MSTAITPTAAAICDIYSSASAPVSPSTRSVKLSFSCQDEVKIHPIFTGYSSFESDNNITSKTSQEEKDYTSSTENTNTSNNLKDQMLRKLLSQHLLNSSNETETDCYMISTKWIQLFLSGNGSDVPSIDNTSLVERNDENISAKSELVVGVDYMLLSEECWRAVFGGELITFSYYYLFIYFYVF